MKFGGPKEVTGAIDLIGSYKLAAHHDFYCKRSIPFSLSDAHYLHNIVGDTDIRKGDGMQLDELITPPCVNSHIQPFALDILQDAFQLHGSAFVELSPDEKGVPTVGSKSRSSAANDKEKRRDKEDKKEKRSHKHGRKDEEKEMQNRHGCLNPTGQSQNCQNKKRKKEGNEGEGVNRQKKSKNQNFAQEGMKRHKTSKVEGQER